MGNLRTRLPALDVVLQKTDPGLARGTRDRAEQRRLHLVHDLLQVDVLQSRAEELWQLSNGADVEGLARPAVVEPLEDLVDLEPNRGVVDLGRVELVDGFGERAQFVVKLSEVFFVGEVFVSDEVPWPRFLALLPVFSMDGRRPWKEKANEPQ